MKSEARQEISVGEEDQMQVSRNNTHALPMVGGVILAKRATLMGADRSNSSSTYSNRISEIKFSALGAFRGRIRSPAVH